MADSTELNARAAGAATLLLYGVANEYLDPTSLLCKHGTDVLYDADSSNSHIQHHEKPINYPLDCYFAAYLL